MVAEDGAVPSRFTFEYTREPNPGLRTFTRLEDGTWVSANPLGYESHYVVVGRTSLFGKGGTIVRRIRPDSGGDAVSEGAFEGFIPDVDTKDPWILFRVFRQGAWSAWAHLAPLAEVDTSS
jgi:hypothetical protein